MSTHWTGEYRLRGTLPGSTDLSGKRACFGAYTACTPGKVPPASLFFFGETGILFYEKQKFLWSELMQKGRPNRAYSAVYRQFAALLDFITLNAPPAEGR